MPRIILSLAVLLLLSLVGLSTRAQAPERFYTTRGHISFFSETPLENIEAHNEKVISFLDVSTGELVFSVLMKEFQFRKKLMQQHFNENFVESDKYPKAYFKGHITNINQVDLAKNGVYQVQVKGTLTIHGKEKMLDTLATLEVRAKQLIGTAAFSVTPQEFDITIPRLVRNNIARRIDITVNMNYEPYSGKSL